MNDHGYTLAEMLAALVMIGLAVGGLTMGVRVIGRGESQAARAAAEGRNLRAVQAALGGLLDNAGPFRTKDGASFQGTSTGFSFKCDAPKPCSAALSKVGDETVLDVQSSAGVTVQLKVGGSSPLHFEYAGYRGAGESWPPPPPTSDVLRSVVLVRDGDGSALASARIWREQPADCAFDPVSGDCREVAP